MMYGTVYCKLTKLVHVQALTVTSTSLMTICQPSLASPESKLSCLYLCMVTYWPTLGVVHKKSVLVACNRSLSYKRSTVFNKCTIQDCALDAPVLWHTLLEHKRLPVVVCEV